MKTYPVQASPAEAQAIVNVLRHFVKSVRVRREFEANAVCFIDIRLRSDGHPRACSWTDIDKWFVHCVDRRAGRLLTLSVGDFKRLRRTRARTVRMNTSDAYLSQLAYLAKCRMACNRSIAPMPV